MQMDLYLLTEASKLKCFRQDGMTTRLCFCCFWEITSSISICCILFLSYFQYLYLGHHVYGCDSSTHDSEDVVRSVGADQKKYLYWLHLQNLYLIHLFVVFAFRLSGEWVRQLNAWLGGRCSFGRSRPEKVFVLVTFAEFVFVCGICI